MKQRLFVLLCGIALGTPLAFGDYELEANASFQRSDYRRFNVDEGLLSVDYFLKPVSTAEGPVAEAAFLNKSSSIGLHYRNFRIRRINYGAVGLQTRLIIAPQPQQQMIVEASFDKGDYDSFSLAAGTYFGDTTEVLVGIKDNDLFEETLFVKAKKFYSTNNSNTLVANGLVQINDGDLGLQARGDYYFDRSTSFGVEAGLFFENETRLSALAIGRHFYNEHFAVEAKAGFVDFGDSDSLLSLGVSGRF